MKEQHKAVACPKCGATSDIWHYAVEYRVSEVQSVSTKTGYLQWDDCDIADDKQVAVGLAQLGAVMPPNFLAHEPGTGGLRTACHIWTHDPALYITDDAKLVRELQDRLMLSESSAEELVAKYRQDKDDTVTHIVLRCSAAQSREKRKDRLVAEVRAMIPLEESRAIALVDKYIESNSASDMDDVSGAGIVRWAVTR